MSRALGLRAMDLTLHLYSNAMPQYLKQAIRDFTFSCKSFLPNRWAQYDLKRFSNSSNRDLPRFFIIFESVVLADAKL